MQQLRAIPDIAGHILDLEAELSRLAAERDAATTKDVLEREDAAFRAAGCYTSKGLGAREGDG